MSPSDPDDVDPTKQSGRPFMLIGAAIGILVVLALLVVVYQFAS